MQLHAVVLRWCHGLLLTVCGRAVKIQRCWEEKKYQKWVTKDTFAERLELENAVSAHQVLILRLNPSDSFRLDFTALMLRHKNGDIEEWQVGIGVIRLALYSMIFIFIVLCLNVGVPDSAKLQVKNLIHEELKLGDFDKVLPATAWV